MLLVGKGAVQTWEWVCDVCAVWVKCGCVLLRSHDRKRGICANSGTDSQPTWSQRVCILEEWVLYKCKGECELWFVRVCSCVFVCLCVCLCLWVWLLLTCINSIALSRLSGSFCRHLREEIQRDIKKDERNRDNISKKETKKKRNRQGERKREKTCQENWRTQWTMPLAFSEVGRLCVWVCECVCRFSKE